MTYENILEKFQVKEDLIFEPIETQEILGKTVTHYAVTKENLEIYINMDAEIEAELENSFLDSIQGNCREYDYDGRNKIVIYNQ